MFSRRTARFHGGLQVENWCVLHFSRAFALICLCALPSIFANLSDVDIPHLSPLHMSSKSNSVDDDNDMVDKTLREPPHPLSDWDPWGEDLKEKLQTDYLEQYADSAEKFLGNQTHKDYFKLLRQDGSTLIIGARNVIYNISLEDLTENVEQRITWNPSSNDVALCLMKGKSEDDCQNYIRVLAHTKDDRLLVCGTNAFNPKCRFYSHNATQVHVDEEFSGRGLCPYDPRHNSTAIYTEDELYSGTVADFSGTDSLILKNQIRTEQYDYKQLNAPDFVNSLEHGDFVYFFFRESAVEYMNCGKVIYSRVGRVCKKDVGGPRNFQNKWTSFLKARLNCSVPGEFPFYFNEIQSTSHVFQGDTLYAAFTTAENSISGSAICSYDLKEINRIFEESPFKNQESIYDNWLPTSKNQVPEPRPGLCSNDSTRMPEHNLNFIKRHSLMDWSVNSKSRGPLFIKTSMGERLTVLDTDPQVEALDGTRYDVIFVGTNRGRVLKLVDLKQDSAKPGPNLIESMQVFPVHIPVRNLMVVRAENKSKLAVLSDHDVNSLPLDRCQFTEVNGCQACVGLQDPYCVWDLTTSSCIDHRSSPTEPKYLLQDVNTGINHRCPAPIPITTEEVTSPPTTTVEELEETTLVPESVTCTCPCEEQSATEQSPIINETTQRILTYFAPFFDDEHDNFIDVDVQHKGTEMPAIEGDLVSHHSDSSAQTHLHFPHLLSIDGPRYEPAQETGYDLPIFSEKTFAISIFLSILTSLSIGFVVGYFLANFWNTQQRSKAFASSSDLYSPTKILHKRISKSNSTASSSSASTQSSNHSGTPPSTTMTEDTPLPSPMSTPPLGVYAHRSVGSLLPEVNEQTSKNLDQTSATYFYHQQRPHLVKSQSTFGINQYHPIHSATINPTLIRKKPDHSSGLLRLNPVGSSNHPTLPRRISLNDPNGMRMIQGSAISTMPRRTQSQSGNHLHI
ncbi:hypothetical protein TCAL_15816 [Tigriopus californicus]|uniref:Sema domain-containing protein n=1 Tax=Tigriopus californicus TaxID=6832 RepID=A0A553NR60_TIGCA|nr:semaphorin-1A-like [Tigriopus californicus]TRY67923.1 hypothetical protein TCAL_15816 [Tigriopus californicus]